MNEAGARSTIITAKWLCDSSNFNIPTVSEPVHTNALISLNVFSRISLINFRISVPFVSKTFGHGVEKTADFFFKYYLHGINNDKPKLKCLPLACVYNFGAKIQTNKNGKKDVPKRREQ